MKYNFVEKALHLIYLYIWYCVTSTCIYRIKRILKIVAKDFFS